MKTRADKILEWVKGPAVLDVGCAGHLPKPNSPYWLHGKVREKFPKVLGLDLNEENVELLRAQGFNDIYVGNAENFELDQKFDTIVAGELFEHLANPGLFLAQCEKHLKKNGRLVISTPYSFSLLYVLYAVLKYPRTCQNTEHTLWLCPQTFQELARRYDFQIIHWELMEDYEFDNPSALYRFFARFVTTFGRLLLPARLRQNNMFFVLVQK
jgi:2-polyprenyl-3-methyl-5-hydroxy-6-metoxy-1,4-benzoquinol methylase